MPHSLHRIVWMPSPPLVPDDAPIDVGHLDRMTLGDAELEREVLAMFAAQASDLVERLIRGSTDAAALAHKLKGSARAIGAFRVAEAAAEFEAAVHNDWPTTGPLQLLRDSVVEARRAIDVLLKRS
jgi:HPt (histidine-containing phosphotransfer) domain-containing protein